jgi:hypothetical protein
MNTLSMLVSSFLCAIALLAPPRAAALEPKQAARVRVVVDARELGEGESFFNEEVGARVRGLVEAKGYEVLDTVDADATVRVRITFFNPEDLDYQIDVDISAGSEIVRLEPLDCPQCVDADLLAKIEGQDEAILAAIDKALAQDDESSKRGRARADRDEGGTQVAPIGPMGGVGIGVLGLGLGLTIAGAIEIGRGEVFDNAEGAPLLTGEDHGPRGRILLGTGVGGVAIGAALLVTDLMLRAKQRKRHRAGAAVPIITPTSIGVGWVGHF